METRKYQLQKQIVEALNTKNNDLYVLLRTQWAHRFGVESLVELDDIDLRLTNEDLVKGDLQENDQVDNGLCNDDETSLDTDDLGLLVGKEESSSKESVIGTEPKDRRNQATFDIAIDQKVSKENMNIKTTDRNIKNSGFENNNIPKVKPLIPLPPKTRYSYLDKWLVRH